MIKPETISKTKPIAASLMANFLLSWTVLPLVIPPFRMYTWRELMDVLLWQGIGLIGWPFGILGGLANLLQQGSLSDLVTLLLVLIYPSMLLLLTLVLFSKGARRWHLILLHVLLILSFAAVWYQVLNGYDFMIG
jgi:hypothetical protein